LAAPLRLVQRATPDHLVVSPLSKPSAKIPSWTSTAPMSQATVPPPDWATIFVFDRGHGMLLTTAVSTRWFACDRPLLRRLSQERFLDVTVAEGADLRSR
jgi:hypothetical protein